MKKIIYILCFVCITPSYSQENSIEEIESILKLTSANIYQIPENANYIDKLGAGRLDAGKAVKMAYKMARPQDFIEIKNREFYRNWSFELKNAPYGIKISNQTFRDSIKIDFTARNYIELKNTVLKPNASGSIALSINPNTPLPVIPSSLLARKSATKQSDNISFFNNSKFILQHFLVNGVQRDLVLTYPGIQDFVPDMRFTFNTDTNQLEASIGGYCNGTSAKYKDRGTYLEVIERGGTTLRVCGGDEDTDYFDPITGNIYWQRPPEKVFYEITQDKTGLWLWANENHKLYFTKEANTTFFNNSKFILQHFLVNGEQQDLVLTHHNGRGTRDVPNMIFTFNAEANQLESSISGYCNGTSAKYKDRGTYLEVIERGATTLADCGPDEDTDYFEPITGNMQRPPKVFYEITQDKTGLWLWANENHKLYFTKETLSIEEEKLQNSIKIYPNPTDNYIEIQANNVQILEISIIDVQGKVVLRKTNKFKKLDVSKFTSGMYFIKIKSKKTTITKKIIVD